MICYRLHCPKCHYNLRFSQGVTMSFNKTNQELLEQMKNGEHGKIFERMAKEHPDAAAHHSHELFRCTACGELSPRRTIELIGADHSILAKKEHLCLRCNSQMELVDYDAYHYRGLNLPCPRCKENSEGLARASVILVD